VKATLKKVLLLFNIFGLHQGFGYHGRDAHNKVG